jgi:suppressor of ftsI
LEVLPRVTAPGKKTRIPKPAHLVILSLVMVCAASTGPQSGDPNHTFVNPVTLTSHNGRLDVDLAAAPASYLIEGHQFHGTLYNGQYMPPLWRLRAGDTLNVTLHNQLTEETNLHFHGLDVSPLNNGDNVFLHIAPGKTFAYEIKIPEKHVGLLSAGCAGLSA